MKRWLLCELVPSLAKEMAADDAGLPFAVTSMQRRVLAVIQTLSDLKRIAVQVLPGAQAASESLLDPARYVTTDHYELIKNHARIPAPSARTPPQKTPADQVAGLLERYREGKKREAARVKATDTASRLKDLEESQRRTADIQRNAAELLERAASRLARVAATPGIQAPSPPTHGVGHANGAAAAPRRKPTQQRWNERIISALRKLEYDPSNLPRVRKGAHGVRKKVRESLGLTVGDKAFERAWDRATEDQVIVFRSKDN